VSMSKFEDDRRSQAWLRPRVSILGAQRSSFHVCGVTGLVLGALLAMFLAGRSGLSSAIVCGLLAMGVLTFLALTMATTIVTGTEALVYYHHEVAVLTMSAVLLNGLRQPVLPYLDVTALGLGVFLLCGRVGCLMVGCCHGRPHGWGVRYSRAHADEGFPACYVGATLFPVQALEALAVASIVAAGSSLVLRGYPPGAAVSWYIVSYSTARIWLEELRGDRVRPYWLRLSEAQWTSAILILSVILGEWQGRLPYSAWHVVMLAAAGASLVLLAFGRTPADAIVHPRHASEIAAIVKSPAQARRGAVTVQRTSLRVGVSTQPLDLDRGAVLYSLSRADRALTPPEARALARLIVNLLSRDARRQELRRGHHEVFHLILHTD
jgi:prolipoprotein diacylglyceryltransferase